MRSSSCSRVAASTPQLNQTGELKAAFCVTRMWRSSWAKVSASLVVREVAALHAVVADGVDHAVDHLAQAAPRGGGRPCRSGSTWRRRCGRPCPTSRAGTRSRAARRRRARARRRGPARRCDASRGPQATSSYGCTSGRVKRREIPSARSVIVGGASVAIGCLLGGGARGSPLAPTGQCPEGSAAGRGRSPRRVSGRARRRGGTGRAAGAARARAARARPRTPPRRRTGR